jgi:general L-amino acid transport system substrate-binding protein
MSCFSRLPVRMYGSAGAALAALVLCVSAGAAQTLAAIKQRGVIACGVSEGIYGFSIETPTGWSGFDVDLCRALAAAVFDDPTKVHYVPLDATARFASLQSGAIDVLSRNSTWTMSREIELKLVFPAVTYYDGQGFLVRRARNATSALELDNVKVCVQGGTTTELNLGDFFRANNLKFERLAFTTAADAVKAYDAGRCDVFTSDVSQLYAERLALSTPDDHVILPDVISKEPLGPVVRQGDEQWANIVKWTAFALINAEELGVSSKSIDRAVRSDKPEVKRLAGTQGDFGEQAGLTRDWVVRIIRSVGNYGEIFERNVGVESKLGIPRGLNQLWTNGGIVYAPPIR